jgi:hypothetical protein
MVQLVVDEALSDFGSEHVVEAIGLLEQMLPHEALKLGRAHKWCQLHDDADSSYGCHFPLGQPYPATTHAQLLPRLPIVVALPKLPSHVP